MPVQLLPLKVVLARKGDSRSHHYVEIQQGLFVRPVAIGARARRYPDFEVAAIVAARIAGKSAIQIKALVSELESARTR